MESMKRATVWEAVSELNSRTLFGRVVVNPPERRGEVKAFPTLDTWYFCKCGKAFQNVERLKEHKNAGGGCQKTIQSQGNKKPKKVKNITIAKTDDETYEIVDMPEKKLPRARISNEQKARISVGPKSRISNKLKARISSEQKARISNEQKARISIEQKARISIDQKTRISNERKSRIPNEHMSRLLKEHRSRNSDDHRSRNSDDHRSRNSDDHRSRNSNDHQLRTPNDYKSRNSNEDKSRIPNNHKFRTPNDHKSRNSNYQKFGIYHDRSQQRSGGIKLKNTLAITKRKPEVPRGIPGFIFGANPAQSTPAVQRSKISGRRDLFECHKCGKVFNTLRTYRIHYTKIHVQIKINSSPSAVLSGSPRLKTMKQASPLTMTQYQSTSKPRIHQTVPVQIKMVQKKAKVLKTKSMKMLKTRGGNLACMMRCEICNVGFTHDVGYFMHVKFKHEGKGILKCQRQHCSYKTLSQHGMEAHMKRFHKERPTSFHLSLRSKDADPESQTDSVTQNKEHVDHNGQNTAENVTMTDETEAISARNIRKMRRSRLPKCYWCKMRFQSTSELLVHSAFAHPHPRSQRKSSIVLSTPGEEAVLSTPADQALVNKPAEEAVLIDPAVEVTESSGRLPDSAADLTSTSKERESIARRISRCRHCSNRFENRTALDDHIKLAHPTKTLSISKSIVSRRRIVKKPVLARNGESANVQSRRPGQSEIRLRVAKTSSAGTPICTVCRKRFPSSKQLQLHMRLHLKISCEKCPFKLPHQAALDRHLRTAHVPNGKFPCTLCTCNYRNSMGLASHMWHHHRIRGVPANVEDKPPEDPPISNEVASADKNEVPTQPESRSVDPPAASPEEISGTLAAQREEACGDQSEPDKVKINGNTYNRCDGCQQWVPKTQMGRHKSVAHAGGDFSCDKCSCVFRTSGSLSSHTHTMHRENTLKQALIAEKLGDKTQGSPRRKAVEKSVEELPGTRESTSAALSKTFQENVTAKRLSPLRSMICRVCKITVLGGVRGMLQHKKIAHPQTGPFRFPTCMSNRVENPQDKSKAGLPISKANEVIKEKVPQSFVQNLRARLEGYCKGAESAAVRSQDLPQDSLVSKPTKQTFETVPQIVSFFSQNANYVKQFLTPQSPPKIPSAFEKSKLIFERQQIFGDKSKEADKSVLNPFGKIATSGESLDGRSSEKTGKELTRSPVLKKMFSEERKETSTRNIQSSIIKGSQNVPSSDNNIRKSRLFPPPPPAIRAKSFDFKLPRYLEKKALSNEVTVSRAFPNLTPSLPSRNIQHQEASSVSNEQQQQSRGLEYIRASMRSVEEDALKRLRGNPQVSIFPVAPKGMSSSMEATRSDHVLKPLATSSHVQLPSAGKTRLSMCHKCKKSFFNHSRLTEHLNSCQVQPVAGMKCGYCGNNFSQDLLIRHMKECGGK